MKIAVTSTQNMGKSTFIQDFLNKWPMYKTPEKSYRDIVKEKNLKINEEADEETQRILLNSLVDQAIESSNEEFVIQDRCVLDNLAYTLRLNAYGKVSDKFVEEVREIVQNTLKLYDVLFFFPISKFNDIPIVADGFRSTDPMFRNEIDAIFKAFQCSYNQGDSKIFPKYDCPAFVELYGNREERIKLASLYVNENGKFYGEEESLVDSGIFLPTDEEKAIYAS